MSLKISMFLICNLKKKHNVQILVLNIQFKNFNTKKKYKICNDIQGFYKMKNSKSQKTMNILQIHTDNRKICKRTRIVLNLVDFKVECNVFLVIRFKFK